MSEPLILVGTEIDTTTGDGLRQPVPDFRAMFGGGAGAGVFGLTRCAPNPVTGHREASVGFEEGIAARAAAAGNDPDPFVGFPGRELYATWGEYRRGMIAHAVVRDCGVAWIQYARHSNPAVEQAWLDDPYGITARGFLAFFKKLYDIADNGHPMMPSAQAIVVAALADLNIDPELEEALRARGDRKGARLSAEARCRLGEALKAKRRRPQF